MLRLATPQQKFCHVPREVNIRFYWEIEIGVGRERDVIRLYEDNLMCEMESSSRFLSYFSSTFAIFGSVDALEQLLKM